jgi:predicted  nucleic acid-binding Zn-ribbon protein
MIDGGQIKDPKALERMLGELESLHRRIGDLEDVEIEVMERLEEAQTAVDRYTSDMAELATEIGTVEVAFEKTSGDLQTQLAAVKDERATAASGMPEDLMALYEKLREQKGGVGAAALRRRECGGCRLTLNASDLSLIGKRPSDDVVRCEECNRILVRTGESGL